MKNKFFNPDQVQARIEAKIERYYHAFKDEDVRKTLEKMPKTQETLTVIETELETVVAKVPGDSSHERWFNFTQGLDAIIGDKIRDKEAMNKAIDEVLDEDLEE